MSIINTMKWITNYIPNEYVSCSSLRTVAIMSKQSLYSCCILGGDISNESPYVKFENYSRYGMERTLDNFMAQRKQLEKALRSGKRCACSGCPRAILASKAEWDATNFTKISVLAISPAWPCQLSCIYCIVPENAKNIGSHREMVARDLEFDVPTFLNILEERDLLALTEPIQLSGGEITIHPQKEKILTALSKYPLQIFTNAIIYDEQIATLIARSDGSFLNVSVDAGTAETYHAVKGMDAFTRVSETLKLYAQNGGHIHPKYIILPENCGKEDLDGFLELCADIDAETVSISCDIYIDHSQLEQTIVDAAIYLSRKGKQKGIHCDVLPYFGEKNMTYILQEINKTEKR